ncbi:MAG: hypothetical protein JWL97_4250 [Gemmatimonadales bacterium]|jgi:hypothetical protein|nr:hypothetical protein [Gemmatimonadales bacterium]
MSFGTLGRHIPPADLIAHSLCRREGKGAELKKPLSKEELYKISFALIRDEPGCKEVRDIDIQQTQIDRDGDNWRIQVTHYGRANIRVANEAALNVHAALREYFFLKESLSTPRKPT